MGEGVTGTTGAARWNSARKRVLELNEPELEDGEDEDEMDKADGNGKEGRAVLKDETSEEVLESTSIGQG